MRKTFALYYQQQQEEQQKEQQQQLLLPQMFIRRKDIEPQFFFHFAFCAIKKHKFSRRWHGHDEVEKG